MARVGWVGDGGAPALATDVAGPRCVADAPDAPVAVVSHCDAAVAVDRDARRVAEPSGDRRAVRQPAAAGAGQRAHLAADQRPDALVGGVGDEDVAGAVDGDALGVVQLGDGWRAVEVAGLAGACEVTDDARGRDAAQPVVAEIGDQHVAVAVERDGDRLVELGVSALAIVVALGALAGDGGDRAVGAHQADAVVVTVGDIGGATGRQREAVGLVKARRGPLAVGKAAVQPGDGGHLAARQQAHAVGVAVGDPGALRADLDIRGVMHLRLQRIAVLETGDAGASEGAHLAGLGVELADAVVAEVGDHDVAGVVKVDAARVAELGGLGVAVSEAVAAFGEAADADGSTRGALAVEALASERAGAAILAVGVGFAGAVAAWLELVHAGASGWIA